MRQDPLSRLKSPPTNPWPLSLLGSGHFFGCKRKHKVSGMKARQCFRIVVEVNAQAILDLFRPFVEAGHTLELLRMRPQENLLVVTATLRRRR